MTAALPAAPAPAPRRQVLVATAVAAAGLFVLMGGMLSLWLKFRAAAPLRESADGLYMIKDWLPASIKIPEVAANTMLSGFGIVGAMAQWAVYAGKRGDSVHRSLALVVTFLVGLALANAQIAVWIQMDIGVADGAYQSMFFAITGTMFALILSGLAFTVVAFFRSVGGRADDRQVLSAHALYWYFLTATFVAMWFVVYVQK